MKDYEPDDEVVLGIYISSFHITRALVNLNTRKILPSSYHRSPLNSRGSADDILNTCCIEITKGLNGNEKKPTKIGIAIPGPFDYENGISYIKNVKKYDALYGLNVKQLLAEKLNHPLSDIWIMNDAACFLKGEVFSGAARGFERAVCLIMGTGLGAARFCNGQAEDANLWQIPFLEGTAEDYLATRWFLKRYYEQTGLNTTSIMELSSFYPTSPTVKNIFKEYVGNLAVFIDEFSKTIAPEVVILGGDISKTSACFLPGLKVQLNKMGNDTPVFVSTLHDEAPIIGAATHWC